MDLSRIQCGNRIFRRRRHRQGSVAFHAGGGVDLRRTVARQSSPTPPRALYVPVEDDDKELRRRQAAIAEHYEIAFADHERQFMIAPLAGKRHRIGGVRFQEWRGAPDVAVQGKSESSSTSFSPGSVIVPNRVNAFGVNQNEDAQARQCMQLLAAIALEGDCAVIMPGHVSVAGMATNTGTSGSVQWSNACRSRLFLSRIVDSKEKEELDTDARLLEVRKANWGADQPANPSCGGRAGCSSKTPTT